MHTATNDNPAYPTSARFTTYQLTLPGAQSGGAETLNNAPAAGLQKCAAKATAGAIIQTSALSVSTSIDHSKNSDATESVSNPSTR